MFTTLESLVDRDKDHDCHGKEDVCVRVMSVAELPTIFGDFRIVAFFNSKDEQEHIAIVRGDVIGAENVPTRLHSECLTGDALGSIRCDCREQLQSALEYLGKQSSPGLLLYLRQEGRGIGLTNKIKAYHLQDHGMDTVDANLALGFKDDERDYAIAAHMITSLGVKSIQLLTNNPQKIKELQQHHVNVTGRIPHVMAATSHNRFYLETKVKRFGHWMDLSKQITEQSEPPLKK